VGRIISVLVNVVSIVALPVVLFVDWRLLLRPIGWFSPPVGIAAGAAVLSLYLWVSGELAEQSGALRYLRLRNAVGRSAHIIAIFRNRTWLNTLIFSGPTAYAVTVPPFAPWSWPGYLVAATVGPLLLFWFPRSDLFHRDVRFYPYRPNEYIDMYDDSRSGLWLTTDAPRVPRQHLRDDEEVAAAVL
jgi:hypothetical protein